MTNNLQKYSSLEMPKNMGVAEMELFEATNAIETIIRCAYRGF